MIADITPYIRALRGPILVTGGSGFIGANLFSQILAIRSDVFAVERIRKGWRLADVADQHVITADLNDSAALKNLIDEVKPQTVFDCTAFGAYSFEVEQDLIFKTNLQSVVRFTAMLAERPFSAFVHAGSSSEYGLNCSGPSESSYPQPNSDYAVSKLAATQHLQYMGKIKDFPCVSLRLYSVYGPLEDTSRLVPNLLREALRGRFPPLVDPTVSRDFVHVGDVCSAFILAAAQMNPSLYGEVFNIGSGVKTTIAELAVLAKKLFEISADPIFGDMSNRGWDVPDWYADSTKAAAVLDWRPTIGLSAGLQSTSQWVASLSDHDFMVSANKSTVKRTRSISAIVACYKDGEAIPVMYRRLTETFKNIGIDYEIIFVNDCSPDGSAEIIQAISANDTRVLGISHSRNFGSQMAFRSGMELSTKDSVVLLDGDLQDPPELIAEFVEKWDAGYDVVYGRRVKRDMPFLWGILYKLFYRIFAAFSYVPIPLDAGDFSLMDRRVIGWLLNCGERDLFMRGLRAYVGFPQIGVDYVRPERMFGRSTNNFFKNIGWAKTGIFSFSNTPLTILTATGVVLLFLSILVSLAGLLLKLFIPTIAPSGITTLLLAVIFFGSLNLFAVGLVGEYVAKIIIEVKGRPRLIRSALIRNGLFTELLPDGKVR